MNIENKVLQVENISQIPFDNVLALFQQGYRLSEYNNGVEIGLNVRKGNSIVRHGNIKGLATCPSTVTTGGVLTLSATAGSGTVPYTYHWSVKKPDGSTDTSLTGSNNSYTFGQNGNYTVSVYVTDSCAGGSKTSNTDSCSIVASADGGVETHKECVGNQCTSVTGAGANLCYSNADCEGDGEGTKYNCVSNVCQGPFMTGTYDSFAECQASGCGSGNGGGGESWFNGETCLSPTLCVPNKGIVAGVGILLLIVLIK